MTTVQASALNIDLNVKKGLAAAAVDVGDSLGRRLNQMLAAAGLVINGAGTKIAKTGASIVYAIVGGVLVKVAAGTAMAALSGTVANAAFNVYALFMDASGNVTSAMGTAGATLWAVVMPPIPTNVVCVGLIVINPTGTGAFVGGTTNLDDATVVPNAAYISLQGTFNPASAAQLVA